MEEKNESVKELIERCNDVINQFAIWTGEESIHKCTISHHGEILLSVTEKQRDKRSHSSLLRPISPLLKVVSLLDHIVSPVYFKTQSRDSISRSNRHACFFHQMEWHQIIDGRTLKLL
jgi:hypothetical protein